ncbi:ribonuclease T2-like protein [Chlamydoabsidia padenii]|nr:ribonuclease T2-like protein [Chlamydoabsidia padenii]
MVKLWASLVVLIGTVTTILGKKHYPPLINDQCGRHPPQSCSLAANTTSLGSCCIEKKAGLFLLSQFWDVHAGYEDRWTIHGLWNDFCNGSYPSNCDPSREYSNITEILVSRRAFRLLQEMNNDWPNSAGHVDDFWSHEWNKHGTCMSTFEPNCYENKDVFQGMIDFYNTTMKLHQKYNIYKALKRNGITPGHTYSTARVQKAIKKEFDMFPDLRCDTNGHLVETWMYFYVNGPVKRMDIVPTHNNNATNCNSTLIYPTKYPNDTANPKLW